MAADAHRQCRFGQWYYNQAPQKLHDNAAFAAMEIEHERMHRLASRLLDASETRKVNLPHDYDEFSNALDRLRLQIYTLKREIEDTPYNRDPLTGVESRVGMLTKLREQLELVKRRIQNCCIGIMDLDQFKVVNDTHGHLAGDFVLAAFAHHVMEHVRTYGKVFRYGGEEFLNLPARHRSQDRLRPVRASARRTGRDCRRPWRQGDPRHRVVRRDAARSGYQRGGSHRACGQGHVCGQGRGAQLFAYLGPLDVADDAVVGTDTGPMHDNTGELGVKTIDEKEFPGPIGK